MRIFTLDLPALPFVGCLTRSSFVNSFFITLLGNVKRRSVVCDSEFAILACFVWIHARPAGHHRRVALFLLHARAGRPRSLEVLDLRALPLMCVTSQRRAPQCAARPPQITTPKCARTCWFPARLSDPRTCEIIVNAFRCHKLHSGHEFLLVDFNVASSGRLAGWPRAAYGAMHSCMPTPLPRPRDPKWSCTTEPSRPHFSCKQACDAGYKALVYPCAVAALGVYVWGQSLARHAAACASRCAWSAPD